MIELSDTLVAARRSGDYSQLLQASPYGRYMGFEVDVEGDTTRLRLPFQDRWVGNPKLPSLHGGVVGAVLELAGLVQLVHSQHTEGLPQLVDLTVDYLRQARAEQLIAEAEVLRAGRRVANLRMVAYQGDRQQLVASGRGHFLVV